MQDPVRALKPWVVFAGSVLVVVVLYWAQAVFVPIALSLLLTFLLSPLVTALQRRIGRVPAVLGVVTLAFAVLGLGGWGVTTQLVHLANELPGYRGNIRQKITDIRGAGKGGSVEKVQDAVDDIKAEMARAQPDAGGTGTKPVIVKSEQVAALWKFPTKLGPLLEPLATSGLVVVMVIFMLLERQELRNRLIGILGHGRLANTTRALDEAGTRISRYLLIQSIVNVTFGAGVGLGLWALGVPYPLLWAGLAATLRFIPYVGPILAAIAPILVSLAVMPGWLRPLAVVALFVVLELFTNLVLETALYADAAGISQVGLLIAVAFWTWLWGPAGLLMATPLTVCLVVLSKHIPPMELLGKLMSDAPVSATDVTYYQRLLAGDQAEAADIIEKHVETGAADTVYDALMLPALTYAERDREEGRLSTAEEDAVVQATRDLLADTTALVRAAEPATEPATPEDAATIGAIPILGWAANARADEVALDMLGRLLESTPFTLEVSPAGRLASELIAAIGESRVPVVCLADLPPNEPVKARYLVRKLRATFPELKIIVGRWAPASLADEGHDALLAAGADYVGSTLLGTREHLYQLVPQLPRAAAETEPARVA